jgi:hypothetical protein
MVRVDKTLDRASPVEYDGLLIPGAFINPAVRRRRGLQAADLWWISLDILNCRGLVRSRRGSCGNAARSGSRIPAIKGDASGRHACKPEKYDESCGV